MLWLLGLLWPLLGIHPDGTLSFGKTLTVWLYIFSGTAICLFLYLLNKSGALNAVTGPIATVRENTLGYSKQMPVWIWLVVVLVLGPFVSGVHHPVCPGCGCQCPDLYLSRSWL